MDKDQAEPPENLSAPLPPRQTAPAMTSDELKDITRRIYGARLPFEEWPLAMASALGVDTRLFRRWVSGRNIIPPGAEADIRTLLAIATGEEE